jgi:hypothetical protein
LWLGHVGDARDLRGLLASEISALVDLALDEPPATVTRELVYCRFPLVDGPGNPAWLLRAAIETTASLLRSETPTLVFCGAGMSRSPAIAAAALAVLKGRSPEECLAEVMQLGTSDVSPGLWRDVSQILREDQPAELADVPVGQDAPKGRHPVFVDTVDKLVEFTDPPTSGRGTDRA